MRGLVFSGLVAAALFALLWAPLHDFLASADSGCPAPIAARAGAPG